MKPTVVCLMGPTASGKTDLAVELVQHDNVDIISVDSAMIYRDMNIGTAKPTADVLRIAPHRLIDIRDPAQSYSAADFLKDALAEIRDIISQGKTPLLVGGTMLYFKALQEGLSDLPSADEALRDEILQEANSKGWQALHDELAQRDPESAKRIHPNDPQRLQRAIEVMRLTGKTLSELWSESKSVQDYHFVNLAIVPEDRTQLHARIAERFEQMLKMGFVDEVNALRARGDLHLDLPSMRCVGYRQVWQYLDGKLTQEEMKEKGIIATRQLAKRQLTWLRSWPDLTVFDRPLYQKIREYF